MARRRYLLLPMQPTPNGRLHIGHGGGPYLRADVLARALRRDSHQVAVLTGSDAHENWVLADGLTSGRTPAETCALFHAGIGDDLALLGVDLDAWIDPLGEEHAAGYTTLHEHLLRRLTTTGVAFLARERIPVNARTGDPVVGTWIAGRCPTCQQPCGGNTCTACGDHFQPEQLLDAHSRLDNDPIRWTNHESWFVRAPDPAATLAALSATGLPNRFLPPVRRYLARQPARIRLSQPGAWGIRSSLAPAGSVLANTYYAYCLYLAHLHTTRTEPTEPSAFTADSDTITIGLFGTDNSIAGLLAPHAIAAASETFTPFNHTIINHMLHVDGHKCSTSKQHGLWIADVRTIVTSDELRYVLSHIPLDEQVTDLTTTTIVEQVNRLRRWTTDTLTPLLTAYQQHPPSAAIRHDTLDQALKRQRHFLNSAALDLASAARDLDRWIFDTTIDPYSPDALATWLHGAALLTYPTTPTLATHIWNTLGHPATPTKTVPMQESRSASAVDDHCFGHEYHRPLTDADLHRHLRLDLSRDL